MTQLYFVIWVYTLRIKDLDKIIGKMTKHFQMFDWYCIYSTSIFSKTRSHLFALNTGCTFFCWSRRVNDEIRKCMFLPHVTCECHWQTSKLSSFWQVRCKMFSFHVVPFFISLSYLIHAQKQWKPELLQSVLPLWCWQFFSTSCQALEVCAPSLVLITGVGARANLIESI